MNYDKEIGKFLDYFEIQVILNNKMIDRIDSLEKTANVINKVGNLHQDFIESFEKRIVALENRFSAPEPQPACKQNQVWMLDHLCTPIWKRKIQCDIGELEEQELERDISLVKDD